MLKRIFYFLSVLIMTSTSSPSMLPLNFLFILFLSAELLLGDNTTASGRLSTPGKYISRLMPSSGAICFFLRPAEKLLFSLRNSAARTGMVSPDINTLILPYREEAVNG